MSTPSPYQLQAAMTALAEAYAELKALDPNMPEEDARLYQDMLEGQSEGADPWQVVDELVDAIITAEQLAEDMRERRQQLAERIARFTRRAEWLRKTTQEFLERLEVKRLIRAEFTASLGPGPAKVIVTDIDALPPQYQRITVEPNRVALSAALKLGDEIPGAVLSNPQPILRILTK